MKIEFIDYETPEGWVREVSLRLAKFVHKDPAVVVHSGEDFAASFERAKGGPIAYWLEDMDQ